ncbi:hypothetical protein PHLGIDRAFT_171298 [Phlebiopsis gigantea 11061_1 CR5-6]|uniref:Uncharacterized protein n=1 Tax=Phlebiopsis gigantea (strain 11061_1 CR5-6) TaxID=745531 RepID=A0A0C3SCI6_PHLG1|nr:hypothetical protein PHLGIDRAFT_171298 [Phlebiopsis gigantea 11061_1 CR5-6]
MGFIEHLILAATALYPLIEPFLLYVAHEWAPVAGSVAVTELVDATIRYLTIGPSLGNNTTSEEFLAAAMADAYNDSALLPAVVPDSDLNHPLVTALGGLVEQLLPIEEAQPSPLSHAHLLLVFLALCSCVLIALWMSSSSLLPRWLAKQDDLDRGARLKHAIFTGLSDEPVLEMNPSKHVPVNASSISLTTRMLGLLRRPLRSLSAPLQESDGTDTPELSPIMFSNPTFFPSDDPDLVHVPPRPSNTLDTCDHEIKNISAEHSTSDPFVLDCSDVSTVPRQGGQNFALVAIPSDLEEIECPPTPTPSSTLDVAESFAAAAPETCSQDIGDPLGNTLDQTLESSWLVSTSLAGPNTHVPEPTPIAQVTDDVRVCFVVASLNNETTSPVAANITTHESDGAFMVQPERGCNSPAGATNTVSGNDEQRTSIQTTDHKEPLLDNDHAGENLAVVPSSAFLVPGTSLHDIIDEELTAEDWTTIKCFYGMMDDEMNINGQVQMTIVRDRRLPLYHPGPSSSATLVSAAPTVSNDDITTLPAPSLEYESAEPRRRTRTEPSVKAVRKASLDVDPGYVLSFTGLKQDVLASRHCSVVASGFIDRFEQGLPQIRRHFYSMSTRLGLIPHERGYIRYIPKGEERLALEKEARALKLATDALQGKGSFKFSLLFPRPPSDQIQAKVDADTNSESRPDPEDDVDSSVSVIVLGDDSLPAQQPEVLRPRTRAQTGQLTGDNRVPRWIAPPETPCPNRPARSRTLTFEPQAADFEADMLPATHKRAVSEGTLLQEAGARSKKAKMATLKSTSRNALLGSQGPRVPKVNAAADPSAKVVPPRPVARRRSSRPQPSLMGTPKLETIIGSPTTDPPAKEGVEDVPVLSLDQLADSVFGGGDKGKQKAVD